MSTHIEIVPYGSQTIATWNKWNAYITKKEHATFLQGLPWVRIQIAEGRKVMLFAEKDGDAIIGGGVVITYPVHGKYTYLYCPRGPIGEVSSDWFLRVKEYANKENALFLRLEPSSDTTLSLGGSVGSIVSTNSMQPAETSIVNLSSGSETILSAMHSKTRYNIGLSKKKGVTVQVVKGGEGSEGALQKEAIETFVWLIGVTSKRDQFGIHPASYYKTLFKTLEGITLYTAMYEEKPIAAIMTLTYGDTTTYLHGASANEYRNVMAPYLLQWQAMHDASDNGIKYYDLWGITTSNAVNHPWVGITRFKGGFGGYTVSYPGTFDLIYKSALYCVYKFVRAIRRII